MSFPEITEVPPEEAPAPLESPRPRDTTPRPPAPIAPGSSAGITLPPEPPPRPRVDWDLEKKRSAQATIERETEKERQQAMFGGHPEVPQWLRPPPDDHKEFAWSYRANRFEGGVLRISERCALILGIIPVCQLGKMPVRSDLFADMAKDKAADELDYLRSHSTEPVDRQTRLELKAIERLLGQWRAERGSYPAELTDLVAQAPGVSQGGDGRLLILDAWQNKVMYRQPGAAASACDYDLYSLGPNGIDDHGAQDDIVSCGSTPELSY